MCPAAFAALFAAILVYSRCEFTLAKDGTWRAKQDRAALAAALDAAGDLTTAQVRQSRHRFDVVVVSISLWSDALSTTARCWRRRWTDQDSSILIISWRQRCALPISQIPIIPIGCVTQAWYD